MAAEALMPGSTFLAWRGTETIAALQVQRRDMKCGTCQTNATISPSARNFASRILVKERLGVFEVACVETFAKLRIERLQKGDRVGAPTIPLEETRKVQRCA